MLMMRLKRLGLWKYELETRQVAGCLYQAEHHLDDALCVCILSPLEIPCKQPRASTANPARPIRPQLHTYSVSFAASNDDSSRL
jgi:hypothetical protein